MPLTKSLLLSAVEQVVHISASGGPPNKACTGRWGFCRVYEHFSGFEFSLLPSRVRARPSASNANR